ncbi:zinc ribbon domain-containing protein [Salinimicrobium flavum]|uniref:Zinc ribbon domain-containing protein n=1 Tax=Salinimicrobium flavum TaxID=1737065 RepID=A0ABW5J1C4_9FLAO
MKPLICQSCGFPFSEEFRGTNRDHTKSMDFCISCFKNGEYTDHHLTMHELERRLLEMAHEHNEISLEEAQQIIKRLPNLKRWKMTNIL